MSIDWREAKKELMDVINSTRPIWVLDIPQEARPPRRAFFVPCFSTMAQ